MRAPQGGRGGGGGFGGGGGNVAEPGTYVVTLTAGGQTYKQNFRVERVAGADENGVGPTQDEEEDDNINGGILPAIISPFRRWWWEK